MRRRREQQKQDREQRILRAAGRLFSTRGYSRTSVEDIARASRLAVGTVYNYVDSKSELLLTILRRETDDLIAAGGRIADEMQGDPVAGVASLLDLFVTVISRHDRRLWRELFSAAIADPLTIGARAFENDARLVAQLGALMGNLKARGEIDPGLDTTRVAMAFYSVAFSWSMAFLMSDEMTLESLREEIRQGVLVIGRGVFRSTPAGTKQLSGTEKVR
jgi:AcrR family transcriptional regulator